MMTDQDLRSGFEERVAASLARFPQVAPHIERLRALLAKEGQLMEDECEEEGKLLLATYRLAAADRALKGLGL